MKDHLREMYDKWPAGENHQLIAAGNMRAPSRKQMIEWALDARKNFKIYALSNSLNGYDDDEIMCTKYGPCKDLLERLKNLEGTDVDPFEGIPEDEY